LVALAWSQTSLVFSLQDLLGKSSYKPLLPGSACLDTQTIRGVLSCHTSRFCLDKIRLPIKAFASWFQRLPPVSSQQPISPDVDEVRLPYQYKPNLFLDPKDVVISPDKPVVVPSLASSPWI
jgi:hypothetical protein